MLFVNGLGHPILNQGWLKIENPFEIKPNHDILGTIYDTKSIEILIRVLDMLALNKDFTS